MAVIYCFSATGNSLYAAKRIGEALDCSVISTAQTPEVCKEDTIGFVFPTYFFGMPNQMKRFLKDLKIAGAAPYIFGITTYNAHAGGALGALKQAVQKKGLELSYGAAIQAVGTYLPMYAPNDSPQRQSILEAGVQQAVSDILRRAKNQVKPFGVKDKAAGMLFPGKKPDCDSRFTVSDACTGCGACRAVCPAGNIEWQGGKPVFLHHCEHCMGCVHWCPSRAIEWGGKTQGRARYHHPQISLEEMERFQKR